MHVSLELVLACSIGLLAVPAAAPSLGSANTVTPDCECVVTRNDFAVSIAGQGVLTECIACTPNSPLHYCTAAGNMVWTPSANCCATASDWGTIGSGFLDNCSSGLSLVCSGPTTSSHSCVKLCTDSPGTPIVFIAGVDDCNVPRNNLGGAQKHYTCIVQ